MDCRIGTLDHGEEQQRNCAQNDEERKLIAELRGECHSSPRRSDLIPRDSYLPAKVGSQRLFYVRDEVPDTPCKIYQFALTSQFKVDLIVARCRVVHSFSQFQEGLHNLSWEYEADPNT